MFLLKNKKIFFDNTHLSKDLVLPVILIVEMAYIQVLSNYFAFTLECPKMTCLCNKKMLSQHIPLVLP